MSLDFWHFDVSTSNCRLKCRLLLVMWIVSPASLLSLRNPQKKLLLNAACLFSKMMTEDTDILLWSLSISLNLTAEKHISYSGKSKR
jgi:hypothetical protein